MEFYRKEHIVYEKTPVRSKDSPRNSLYRGRDVEFPKSKVHALPESRRMFDGAADARRPGAMQEGKLEARQVRPIDATYARYVCALRAWSGGRADRVRCAGLLPRQRPRGVLGLCVRMIHRDRTKC
jgi:hypothetical protein